MNGINKKHLITAFCVGFIAALAVFFGQGGFAADRAEMYRRLCDACFVPGVMLAGAGLLVYVSSGGAFDILRYGVSRITVYFWSREKREKMPHTYYEYVQEQREKPARAYGFLLLAGGVFLALSVLFLLLHNGAR